MRLHLTYAACDDRQGGNKKLTSYNHKIYLDECMRADY